MITVTPNQRMWSGFIVGFILALILTCGKSKVNIPAVYGTLYDTIKVTHTEYKTKEKPVIKYIPYKVIDTIKVNGQDIQIKPLDTLKTQNFNKILEDDIVKITASGIVTGRIESLQIDYTRKEFKVDAVQNSVKVLIGGGLKFNQREKEPVLTGGVILQYKNSAIMASYDTGKYWGVGYYVNILK